MKNVKYIDLGLSPYREVWQLQKELLEKIRREKKDNRLEEHYLLFTEHPNVYTIGKSGDEANMLMDALKLRSSDTDFIKVDRGGDITYHGPGQQVVYPIFDLEEFSIGVKTYVQNLEQVVINVLHKYGITADRLEGATGVWLDSNSSNARKICAIGVKCSNYITMHGLALNVNTNLKYFDYINPCGFKDKGVTSVSQELGCGIETFDLKKDLLQEFQKVFGLKIS
ncbi:MAG: lipoyl(octanoyl) transferase LipB [Culturomica sp.]|jgi:lipoyl(octanoyl) transferase|nr:lipoyl(octanoyl) transferase LipB [Culturomica sp.]